MDPRTRRLHSDHENLKELVSRSPFVRIVATEGTPPEKYVLELSCKGITDVDVNGRPIYSEAHRLGIHLHNEYPRRGPTFQMLTPVFHPNIARSGAVCIGDEGDHGWAPSMRLDDVVIRIINIIRYENIGWSSPFNLVACTWARQHQSLFPLDTRPILLEELDIVIDEISLIDPAGGDELDIKIW